VRPVLSAKDLRRKNAARGFLFLSIVATFAMSMYYQSLTNPVGISLRVSQIHRSYFSNSHFPVMMSRRFKSGHTYEPLNKHCGTRIENLKSTVRERDFYKIGEDIESKKSKTTTYRRVNEGENDEKWLQVFDALLTYRDKFGNLLVPHRFIIPEDDMTWPPHVWGLKLGQKVRNIRSVGVHVKDNQQRVDMLNEIGFVWDDNEFRWRQSLKALQTYKAVYGALNVPLGFSIPAEEPWEPICWGVNLGERVHNIRAHGLHIASNYERKKVLDSIGFIWSSDDYKFAQVVNALKRYKELYGNVWVGQKFIVPRNSTDWPKELWGLKLGDTVRGMRTTGRWWKHHFKRRKEIEELGLMLNEVDMRWERIFACLESYKKIYGNLNIKNSFVVPHEEGWDEVFWGIPLGARVRSIRQKRHHISPQYKEMLDELGFNWCSREAKFDEFLIALRIYQENYGNVNVPRTYSIPLDDEIWPRRFHGLNLGQKLWSVRYKGIHIKGNPERCALLLDLGVDVQKWAT